MEELVRNYQKHLIIRVPQLSGSRGVYVVQPFEWLILSLFFGILLKERLMSFKKLVGITVIFGLALWSAVRWLSPVYSLVL